jgi:apolipoprotein N-acyltransferase
MQPVRKWVLALLVLLSSVLLPLALPNDFLGSAVRRLGLNPDESLYWGNAVLGFIAIAPVFYAISVAPTFGFASLLGVIFGAVSTALSSFWLMFFQGFSVWTYGGTTLGYVGYNSLLFPFLRGFARIGAGSTRSPVEPRSPRVFRPFLLAGAWALYEYFKSVGFLGYPWGLISYPVGGVLPLIQIVDVTGVWGLSFFMALVNALVAEVAIVGPLCGPRADTLGASRGPRHLLLRQAAFVAFLAACILGYGVDRLATPIPHGTTASLLLVQQNMDPWDEGQGSAESFLTNAALTVAGVKGMKQPPDLAVWSESSVSNIGVTLDKEYSPKGDDLVAAIRSGGVPVLFGGVVIVSRQRQEAMNAAILADADGNVVDTYGKIHPVPFAESIPFFEVPWVKAFFRDVVGIWNPWVSGTRFTTFRVPLRAGGELAFGVPICFEDAFASHVRGYIDHGADILVNITNDSWSKTWSSEIQHFVAARFRAVENRRVLVRSTNGGVTSVVGPWGELRAKLPYFEQAYLPVDVPVYRESRATIYTRWGDWFAWVLAAALFGVLLFDAVYKKRRLPLDSSLLF